VFVSPLLLLRRVWYGYAFRRIKLANCKKYAIVDPCNYPELSKYVWFADSKNGRYSVIRFNETNNGLFRLNMHRQIMFGANPNLQDSRADSKLIVDHKNRNALDNRRCNLRLATGTQNARNRSKDKRASSKYKGVSWRRQQRKWIAQISVNRKKIYLGYFDDELEAAKAYDAAAKKYHGEFACLNFPPPDKRGLKNLLKYWFCHSKISHQDPKTQRH